MPFYVIDFQKENYHHNICCSILVYIATKFKLTTMLAS